jgi:tripartite-type tricarboxylate transporter receptor subunit TctC
VKEAFGKEVFMKGRALWTIVAAVMLLAPQMVKAEYPDRPVTIVVAFDAGSATDLSTRILASTAEKILGKPIVVENKGGGGGAVALGVVANAKPDGYTLCGAPNVSIIDTPLMQKVTYKPLKSFTPIVGHSAAEHTGLVVKADAPWKTFQEFIDYAKKNPGKVKYSSAGVGTGMHVAMELIAHKDGIKWVHIPYKGVGASITAVLGGHVDVCTAGLGYQEQVKAGALRILATHGLKRSPDFPAAPTLKEFGYDFYNDTVHSIVGPAGLPPEVTSKLEAAFLKAMESPEFKNVQKKLYLNPVRFGSKEWDTELKEKWTRTEKQLKAAGIITEAATPPM